VPHERSLKLRQYGLRRRRVITDSSEIDDDLTLPSYKAAAFSYVPFGQRQMLLPHSAVHHIKPRLNG
jgi:hypothetical protein